MTYRVRRQALTGKLVLQDNGLEGWRDVRYEITGAFEIVPELELHDMRARIAKADRRANAQRTARANRQTKEIA